MNERNVLLDVLKGFTIVLVVLGHSIQYVQINNFDEIFLFRLIYSFHMPLFMFVSGYVSFKTFDGSFKKLIKRFKSLIIPFWAWFLFSFSFSALMFFFKGEGMPSLMYSLKSVLKSPDYGLWFLWVLFLNYIVLFLSLKTSSRREEIPMFIILIGINLFLHYTRLDVLGIGLLSWHLRFYLLGYIVNKYKNKLNKVLNVLGIISFCIYPILVLFWRRTENPTFIASFELSPVFTALIAYTYKLLVPISGIVVVCTFFKWLTRYDFILKKSLISLGNLSLEIYSSHFYFFMIVCTLSFLPYFFQIAVIFIIALFGSLIIQFLIKKNIVLSNVFYGK